MAAGTRVEQRREEALQGAGAQPENSGSPRGSLPAPCPSRSAWVGGSGRWTWRRYLRGGNREAWRKGGKGRREAQPGGASHSRGTRRMGPGRGCGEAGQPLTPARGCAARARPRRLRAAPDRTPPDPRLGCAAFRPGRAAPPTLCRRSRPPASLLPCPQRHRSAPGTQAAAAGPAAPNMAATTAGPRLFPSAAAGNNRSGEEREGGAPPPPGRRLRVNSGNTRRR